MTANQNLKTYKEEVSEDRQVHDFLDGITCGDMKVHIATIWANANLSTSVAVASNYLSRFIPVDLQA